MPIPITDAFAHRISAVEQLDEAHSAFDEPAGKQTIPGKARFEIIGVVNAVKLERGGAFAREIGDFSGTKLHPGGQFITGDAGAQVGVPRMSRHMPIIEEAEEAARGRFVSGNNLGRSFKVGNGFIGVEGGALKNRG